VEPMSRPVYCGSHPYFGGYALTDECFGDAGPSLFEYEAEEGGSSVDYSLTTTRIVGGLQADIFCDSVDDKSFRVIANESQQSIMSPMTVPKFREPVSSASFLCSTRRNEGGICIQHTYVLVQRYGHNSCILRSVESKPKKWNDRAAIECDDECKDFQKQIVNLGETRIVGMSYKALWLMEIPQNDWRIPPMSAADMATQVSWRKILELPEVEVEDDRYPHRYLALGPQSSQVVIFAPDEHNPGVIRPRLLVQLSTSSPDGQDVLGVVHLTSILHVPLQSQEVCEKALSSHLLASIVRSSPNRGGYLFFNEWGQVFHMTDESITLAEHAWAPPDFRRTDAAQRVVTFTFAQAEHASETRMCIMGLLSRYEYFQKLFGQWQEGTSAEVHITDMDSDGFDHFLAYVHSGMLDCFLELPTLVKLLTLGDKYLMQDLIAWSLLQTLRILENEDCMRQQAVKTLADLLTFASTSTASCPTLQTKVIESILCTRGEVVKDPDFLARVSGKSVESLALLLTPLAPIDASGFELPRKRRKTQARIQDSLWRRSSERPRWSLVD